VNVSRRRRIFSASSALAVGCVALLASSYMVPARATALTPVAQLQTYLSAAIAQKSLPDVTKSIPTLTSLMSGQASPIDLPAGQKFPVNPCYPFGVGSAVVQVSDVASCSFGTTSSSKTVVLTGDSNAAMWLAPLKALGEQQGFRVVFFGQAGCPPWRVDGSDDKIMYGTITVGSCDKSWNASVRSVVAAIKPSLVIVSGFTGISSDAKVFQTRLTATVNGFKSASTKVVVLGPIPHASFVHIVPGQCLTTASSNSACILSTTTAVSKSFTTAGPLVATATKATYVDVLPLFCVAKKCPMFAKTSSGNHLIYLDTAHMNRTYAAWIAPQLRQLLGSALNL